MQSAAKVFAQRGLQQASIDEVAEDAGYTKGAFYANFDTKEELFLAMLDERFAERLEEIERVIATDDAARGAGAAGGRRLHARGGRRPASGSACSSSSPPTRRATRSFREELVTRYRRAARARSPSSTGAASSGWPQRAGPARADRADDLRDGQRRRAREAARAGRGGRRALRARC